MAGILVVDDEEVLARSITGYLERRGFVAAYAVDMRGAMALFSRDRPQLVILDVKLGQDSGLDLLGWMLASNPETQVLVMTGHGDIGVAVLAMKRGARDFLTKPAPLATIAAIAAEMMLQDVARTAEPHGVDRIVGRSSAAVELRAAIRRLAASAGGDAAPGVLITGPRGCGKAQVARALHEAARGGRALAEVDCNLGGVQLSQALAGGAKAILLRRIEALDAAAQVELALALDAPDAPWLIATTSAELSSMEQRGAFWSDLLYRRLVGWIEVPPLSERTADILPLAEDFARQIGQRLNRPRPRIGAEARAKLLRHIWPGNIVELENCIERAVLNAADTIIGADDIRVIGKPGVESDIPNLVRMEEAALLRALRSTGGNISRAAGLLGISRDTLRYRMEKYGISRR